MCNTKLGKGTDYRLKDELQIPTGVGILSSIPDHAGSGADAVSTDCLQRKSELLHSTATGLRDAVYRDSDLTHVHIFVFISRMWKWSCCQAPPARVLAT
jgi:hypothetical protein